MEKYQKNFDGWNCLKKKIDKENVQRDLYFYEREVWWCTLGVNIGIESDGKNENFERPVLIIKKFNGEMIWVLPLTSKEKIGEFFHRIDHDSGISWVNLSQIKTISTKRLLRKIGMISEKEFSEVSEKIGGYIKIGPRPKSGPSEAEATNK